MKSSALILIVDDEDHIREGLSDLFTFEGYTTICAENGKEGLEIFERSINGSQTPPIDLLVIDIKMPRLGGLELLKAVHKITDEFPVIIISGISELKTEIQALRRGACEFIVKPFEPKSLLAAVAKALEE